jgi:hypothetical protein
MKPRARWADRGSGIAQVYTSRAAPGRFGAVPVSGRREAGRQLA